MRTRILFLAAAILSAGCDVPDASAPDRPTGAVANASVSVTALTATPNSTNEGSSITITGGTVTALVPDVDLTHVELRWGEIDPATGLEFRTVVCDDSTGPACGASAACDGFSHTYHDSRDGNGATAGDHTVTCYGENSASGQSGTATVTVTIADVATNVDAKAASANTYTVQEDSPLLPTATFTDPSIDGATLYETYNCTLQWGDGSPDTVTNGCTPATLNSAHTYASQGVFTLTAIVTNTQGDAVGQTGPNTATVTVTDHQPLISTIAAAPDPGSEGVSTTFSATVTANANEPIVSCAWNWDDGSPLEPEPDCASGATSASPSASHTFADGDPTVYDVELRVMDADGTTIQTLSYTVSNVAPALSAPSTTTNPIVTGQDVTFTASFTDAADASWRARWDFDYDGVSFSPDFTQVMGTAGTTAATTNYAVAGMYTVAVEVTDQTDGGGNPGAGSLTSFQTATFQVFGAPSFTYTHTPLVAEGDAAAVDIAAVDGNSPELAMTYSIDWDDDGCFAPQGDFCDVPYDAATSRSGSTYYPDVGTHTLRITVTNAADVSVTATDTVTITDAKPQIVAISNTAPRGEGQSVSVHVELAAGTGDGYTIDYSWGDASSSLDCGRVCSHAYADQGSYTISVTVTDDDGNSTSGTTDAAISNVAPSATVASGCTSSAGASYACNLDASDAAGDTVTFSKVFGPAGLSVASATGVVSWTPTADESRGAQTFQIKLRDDDGGESYFTQTVSSYPDSDADGMTDAWEAENAGAEDPTEDPDADGLTNLEEYQAGSDPNSFGGPQPPSAFAPKGGDSVDTTPTITVANATDPDGDVLTYDFQVFADEALTDLELEVLDVAAGGEVTPGVFHTSIDVSTQLQNNHTYYWRARASDPNVDGSWSEPETFRTDAANTAPLAPAISSPANGGEVASQTPDLVVANATDGEDDALTYEFEVSASPLFAGIESSGSVAEGATSTTFTTGSLSDNGTHYWRVRAWDGSAYGPWTMGQFFVDVANEPPSVPHLISPSVGAVVDGGLLELVLEESTDPEGDAITYDIAIYKDVEMTEVVEAFADVTAGPGGLVKVIPTDPLKKGKRFFWSATATDAGGASSEAAVPQQFRTAGGEADDVGSCSVAASGRGRSGVAALVLMLGAALVTTRRRR